MFTKADIEKYFVAEKHESLLFLIVGLAAVLLALIFYFGVKTQIGRGAAIPLLIFGLIQAAVGYTRIPAQRRPAHQSSLCLRYESCPAENR